MKRPIKTLDRTIAGRMRSYDVVTAAIRATGVDAAGILETRYPSVPEGPPAANYHRVLTDLNGELGDAFQRMLAVNTIHQGQLAKVVELAGQRDDLTGGLVEHFVQVRHSLENLYGGVRGFTVIGVTGQTLRDPAGLLKQVRETVDFLGSPKVALPVVEGFNIDHSRVSERLASDAEELEGVLTDHAEARKEAEATRLSKNDAITAYDQTFLHVARTVGGLFHIAGLHDAAERVRPPERRKGSRPDDDETADQEAVSDETATGEAPAESGD